MNIKDDILYQELCKYCGEENVLRDEPMSNHTLTKLGGKADFFVTPVTYEQTRQVIRIVYDHDIPFLFLGNGSNMIVRDGGVRGIVLSLKKLANIKVDGERMIAQGGADIIDASEKALECELTGLEFACGIPGTIGGAMVMNAGAYGGEVKDVVETVTVVSKEGEIFTLSNEDMSFDYRKSIVSKKGYIVLETVFHLEKGDPSVIKETMEDLTHRRESKQPLEYPSAGSVFKRPPGYFAGKLIQDSELQGKGFGGAEVSTKHAGFIVNKGNATATDYISTINMVRKTVKETFGVELELEVKIVGEEKQDS
ncbi:UDP-N-acetylmuramate dehydrogenase [Texcoconibacillus texcoconensis]|uniref:UDP-N-acetylenolpyruvoylglucosamine reductase n=1 Tax=Texcoconibacillus texcoconensis TaxID=1095777 RepID=A0A840QSH9_9BACI|nr:UDP-N-acetylmuramate dehydrogenase [Texcoconibacillus texcoconensis]MBB5174279.1 UDP-N-acetylmuramate dehydrogenase [Texcoconibacillus texcoconensis]